MSNKLEKAVRDPCVAMAKRTHASLHKRMHFGHGSANGWPDDLFVFADGHHWWVEFKGEGKEAAPLQLHTHANMRDYKVDVSVIDSVLDFGVEFQRRLAEHVA